MGKFLTTCSSSRQKPKKGMYSLDYNEVYNDDDDSNYLAWRGLWTDHFTWIVSGDWDTRCSHQHDVGCKYHQVVRIKLTEQELWDNYYLQEVNGEVICTDLPPEVLEVVDVSGHWINNMFYRMLRDADCPKTPKFIQLMYRAGVSLNFGWFRTGKQKIELDKIYDPEWNRPLK